jgi:hypothetical protein
MQTKHICFTPCLLKSKTKYLLVESLCWNLMPWMCWFSSHLAMYVVMFFSIRKWTVVDWIWLTYLLLETIIGDIPVSRFSGKITCLPRHFDFLKMLKKTFSRINSYSIYNCEKLLILQKKTSKNSWNAKNLCFFLNS